MRRADRWLSIVLLGLAACPDEEFAVSGPAPDLFPDAAVVFDVASPTLDVVSGVAYVPLVRDRLAACVTCHGDDGPIEPPLHAYIAARNAADDVIRASEAMTATSPASSRAAPRPTVSASAARPST